MSGELKPKKRRRVWLWVFGGIAVAAVADLIGDRLMGYGPFSRDRGVRFEQSVHINAPVERAFDFMKDPANWRELHPAFVVRDVKMTPEFVGSSLGFAVREHGMRFEGNLEWTEFVPNQRIGVRETGFCEGAYAWTFEPEGTGTRITAAGEYTHARVWSIPLLGRVWEWLVLKGEGREAKIPLEMIRASLEA